MAAILDGVKNVVAAQAAGQAGQYIKVTGGLLSGGLSGDWRGKMNKPGGESGTREEASQFTTKNLAYPENVEGDPQQGHYIMFMINEQDDAKLKAMKEKKNLAAIAKELGAEGLDDGGEDSPSVTAARVVQKAHKARRVTAARVGPGGGLNYMGGLTSRNQVEGFDHTKWNPGATGGMGSLQLQNQATKRLKAAISLYMPPSISVSYGMKYTETEIGMLAETGAAAIKAFRETSGPTTAKLTAATEKVFGMETAEVGLERFVQGALDTIAPGAKALMQLESGRIIAPRMEVMFEGVGRRDFSYTFIFIPKNVRESRAVEKIVHEFKYHMHPEFEDNNARLMKFPSTFDILYMYQNGPNDFLNKISTCFLTKMDVEYGADRFTAYERTHGRKGLTGAPPQKTKLSLSFSEMEILTKERIETVGY